MSDFSPDRQHHAMSFWFRRMWWLPLSAVVAALVVLTALPVVLDLRVHALQHRLSDVSDQARVVVNDLEEGLTTELLASTSRRGGPPTASERQATIQVTRDVIELDSLSRRLDTEAAARASEMRTLVAIWEQRRAAGDTADGQAAAAALASARRLEAYLDQIALTQRDALRSAERVGTLSALALALLALGAAGVVFWVGRRAMEFASEAETGRAALARALDAKASLIRGVTHDLKNPLGAAAGYLELLHDGVAGELTPSQRDMVSRVNALLHVTFDTVADLLDLSRTETRELSVTREDVDLVPLAGTAADDYRAAAAQAGLSLDVVASEEHAVVRTDRARVRQVIGNLLSNAVKYTPRGGQISVRVTRDPDAVWVDVADTGPGIPPELRERVFDEFFRVSGSAAGGVGIGLAISRRIARLLGGDLTVDEHPGGGARFRLRLPAATG